MFGIESRALNPGCLCVWDGSSPSFRLGFDLDVDIWLAKCNYLRQDGLEDICHTYFLEQHISYQLVQHCGIALLVAVRYPENKNCVQLTKVP